MDCRETQKNLETYARGELDAPLALDVAAHLKTCATCRALHDDVFAVRVTLREYAEGTALSASPDFNRRTMEKFGALQTPPEMPNNAPQKPTPRRTSLPQFLPRLWAPFALACIALLVAFAPPLRMAWQAQTAQSALLTQPGTSEERAEREEQLREELVAVAARHPENWQWKAVAFLPVPWHRDFIAGEYPSNGVSQNEKVMDELLRERPHDLWLLTRRLRAAVSHYNGWDYASMTPKEKAGLIAPAKAMLPLAERGAALEPDNAFWSRMLACLRFHAGDTTGALRAVDEAVRKKRMSDYTLEDQRQTLALFSARGPLLAEEKYRIWSAGRLLSDESGVTFRETLSEGIRAEKDGDHAQALRLYESALRLCLNSSGVEMHFMPARLNRVFGRRPNSRWRDIDPVSLNDFVAYAKHHGRPDVAKTALIVAPLATQRMIAWNKATADGWPPGVRNTDTATLALQNAVQPSLRQLMQNGVLLWLALGALVLVVPRAAWRARRRLPEILTRPRGVLPLPGRRAVFGAVALCVLTVLPALVLEIALPAQDFYRKYNTVPTFINAPDWLIWNDDPYNAGAQYAWETLRWLLPLFVVFWAFLASWSLAVRAQERAAGRESRSLKSIFAENDLAALFPPMANWTLNLSTVLSWAALIVWWDGDTFLWPFYLALFCATLCALRVAVRWWRLPHRRAALGLTFVTLHRVIGASVVAGALLWVGLQLAMQPPRNRIDQAIATLLRDGETKVILRRAAELDAKPS